MPKSIEVELKFEDIPLPTGRALKSGSIAEQVKRAAVGKSTLLDNKNQFTSFNNAVKKYRQECRVIQQTQPADDEGKVKIRVWLVDAKLTETSSAATNGK